MNDQLKPPQEPEPTPPVSHETEPPQRNNSSELWIGVGIFIGVNLLLLMISLALDEFDITFAMGWITMVINLILLIVFARYRKGVAGGWLGAFVFLIFLTFIVAPIFWFTACFNTY
ncbi:MAG: hypothetical protein ACFFDE_09820 [Promethearchaeota archaeon]